MQPQVFAGKLTLVYLELAQNFWYVNMLTSYGENIGLLNVGA
jgi:hypothetical protein